MTTPKETTKSKAIIEDVDALMASPKPQKNQKRQRKAPTDEEDDMPKIISQYQPRMKKIKVNPDTEVAELRKKIFTVNDQQRLARRQYNDNVFKNISEVASQIKADYNMMVENEQRLDQLSAAFMKCVRQATTAYKEKLKALCEINLLQNQFEELESEQREETEKSMEKLEKEIKTLRDKLDREGKRKSMDRMRSLFLQAMQNED